MDYPIVTGDMFSVTVSGIQGTGTVGVPTVVMTDPTMVVTVTYQYSPNCTIDSLKILTSLSLSVNITSSQTPIPGATVSGSGSLSINGSTVYVTDDGQKWVLFSDTGSVNISVNGQTNTTPPSPVSGISPVQVRFTTHLNTKVQAE